MIADSYRAPEPVRLGQFGCAVLAVLLGAFPFVLWFGVPWWLDRPQRGAEDEVRRRVTAEVEAQARRGVLDQHAALRAARASGTRLLRFAKDGDGVSIDVEGVVYEHGGIVGGTTSHDLCLRLAVTPASNGRRPKVEAAKQDECPGPPGGHAQAVGRIAKAAETTRAALAAAEPLTEQQASALVRREQGELWSFHPSVIVVDYIALTPAGEVEAAECVQFVITRGSKENTVTAYRLQDCPRS